MDITHNPAESRFEYYRDGQLAVLEYVLSDRTITYTHTYVPAALENRGIASALTEAAIRYGRSQGLELVPRCPFVAAWLKRHSYKRLD